MISEILQNKATGTEHWRTLPERGNPTSLHLLAWIATHLGRSAARLLLYPITTYYVTTASAARRSSYEYFRQMRGSPAHLGDVFRQFFCFAATILDRVYLLRGQFDRFDVKLHGKEVLHPRMESGKGCILLGSHLGSFEVLRATGVMERKFPVKVLMDATHNQNITRLLDALNPEIAGTVIAPDRVDTLLMVKESLDAGFFVGTLGDRVSNDGKTAQCEFLGRSATFPVGPVVLAAMTHSPVILFFGLYRGGNRYDIYFEHFADEIILNRDRRSEEIQLWMQRYAQRLEHYARLAPYNWFNFYPFWDQAPPR
ncbi:MAG TPA: hypothetical protein VFQ83_03905 [Candidatus Udaeobacter sp.]|nr:hypothetical protein [Candidatus Udaeobacter sp.]